jgi:hypothetical protein
MQQRKRSVNDDRHVRAPALVPVKSSEALIGSSPGFPTRGRPAMLWPFDEGDKWRRLLARA